MRLCHALLPEFSAPEDSRCIRSCCLHQILATPCTRRLIFCLARNTTDIRYMISYILYVNRVYCIYV